MREASESAHAALMLRLLLDDSATPPPPGELDWTLLHRLARRNRVLLRVADRLECLGVHQPDAFGLAVDQERRRARALIAIIRVLSDACTERGVDFLFPKAFPHYPDMGSDVDLLVLPRTAQVDAVILAGLPAMVVRPGLCNRIAGATTYRIAGCGTKVDIHHGRLGLLGEHRTYPIELVGNRQRVVIDGAQYFAPARDDQLVVQGLQCVYGRRVLRLADVTQTISAVREGGHDWEHIAATATRAGIASGLWCYLAYVEEIHRRLYERPLLPDEVWHRLPRFRREHVQFRDGSYRLPVLRVSGRVYLRKFGTDIIAGNWDAAARLCLIPVVAAANIARGLSRVRPTSRPASQL